MGKLQPYGAFLNGQPKTSTSIDLFTEDVNE